MCLVGVPEVSRVLWLLPPRGQSFWTGNGRSQLVRWMIQSFLFFPLSEKSESYKEEARPICD